MGQEFCFIEYMKENGEPPYLVAENLARKDQNNFAIFDCGGTETPVKNYYCFPFGEFEVIMKQIYKNKILPDHVKWVEI